MKKLLVALLALAPLSAFAIPITSSVGTFDVTTTNVVGTASVLSTTAWWGSESLAREFAGRVKDELGMPGWVTGPLFAYKNVGDETYSAYYYDFILKGVTTTDNPETGKRDYAVSTRIGAPVTSVPEPTSLALLGIGFLAFGLRRRLGLRR